MTHTTFSLSESGRTRNTWVDLNYGIFHAVGIECELNVASAVYAELRNDVERSGFKHHKLFGSKRECGSDHYAVSGMNAYRVNVFHTAYGYNVA